MTSEITPPESPIYKKWWFWVIVVIVISGISRMGEKQNQPTTTQSQSQQEVTQKTEKEKAVTQPLPPNSPDIHVQALDLVKAYNDPDHKDKQYEGRTILITGRISGVFIPSSSVQLRMAEKGLSADAFIHFADKPVSNVKETLIDNGVNCYLIESLWAKASQMPIGQTITLRCKYEGQRTLTDCTLADGMPSTTSNSPQEDKGKENSPQDGNTKIP